MAALDSYNWFVKTNILTRTDEIQQTILQQRDYMLTLRNEDERERFVGQAMKELNEMLKRVKK